MKLNKIVLAASVLMAVIFGLIASGNVESIDGSLSLEMARNWVNTGKFEPSDPAYGVGGAVIKMESGNYVSSASRGMAVAYIPSAWLIKRIYDYRGYQPAQYFPLESDWLLSLLASFVTPILSYGLFLIMLSFFSQISNSVKKGLVVSLIISLSTNLLPLSKHSFPNLLVTLLGTLLLFISYKIISNKQYWYLLAMILTAVALWWSYNLSTLLAFIIVAYFWLDNKYWGLKVNKSLRRQLFLLGIMTLLLVIIGFKLVGGWVEIKNLLNGEGGEKDWFQAVWGMLFSPGRSIIMYSPVWGLALLLAFNTWKNSRWSRLMIVGTLVYVGFYSLFDIWSGELSWGPRYLAPLIPLAGLVLVDNWDKVNKTWLVVTGLFGLYVQLVGITVPYETQYQGIKVGNFNESSINSRQAQFDYWSLGEFLPKYSPIYRLKKNLVHRWLLVPKYFKKRPDAVFAGGATLPIDGEKVKRFVGNTFKIVIQNPMVLEKIVINKLFEDMDSIRICVKNNCEVAEGLVEQSTISFDLINKLELAGGDQIEFRLFEKDSGSRYELTKLWLNDVEVSMNSYKLVLEDGFYNKNTGLTNDREVLYQRYYDRKAVTNMTADFWWVRQLVYFR